MKKVMLFLIIAILITTTNSSSVPDDIIQVKVNPPCELSYKSKDEVYNIRKSFVAESIFQNPDYEPSSKVFGQIVGGKPWIANTHCFSVDRNMAVVDGVSEETRFINNPTALVALEFRWLFKVENPSECSFCQSDPITTLIPKEIFYNKTKNEINVLYEYLPFNDEKMFYNINGLNANDLGYEYAYIDKFKSTYKMKFSNKRNISNRVHQFQDFIHLGGSCSVPGGCNNASPNQLELEFINYKKEYKDEKKYIYIKLWKQKPLTPLMAPDIVEKIILEKS